MTGEWLTESDVAGVLQVPLATVKAWRRNLHGPDPTATLSDGARVYAAETIEQWLEQRREAVRDSRLRSVPPVLARTDLPPDLVSWSRHAVSRPDVAAPEQWTPLPSGQWRSPTGKVWRESTPHVQRMLAKRRKLGLPTAWTEGANA